MWKGRCLKDGELVDLPDTPLNNLPPYHTYRTPLRTHVVQFGENINPVILKSAISTSKRADLFLVVRTSGVVSPAREMPLIAFEKGALVIEVNCDRTALSHFVTKSILGKAVKILPLVWKELKAKSSV